MPRDPAGRRLRSGVPGRLGTTPRPTGTGGYDLVLTTPESAREGTLHIAKYAPGEKFIVTSFIELHGGPEPIERGGMDELTQRRSGPVTAVWRTPDDKTS